MVISFSGVFYIMAKLSERMGEAMQIKPYFYLYYAGILFFVLALGYTLVFRTADTDLTHMVSNLFLAIGMTFGLVATVKYWGWLIKELL
jgi:hypothetical protein